MKQTGVEPIKILEAWNFYMEYEEHSVSKQEFIDDMRKKAVNKEFASDIVGFLRPKIFYNVKEVY